MDHDCRWRARPLQGALWGAALGDALGLPFEGLPGAAVRERAGALDRFQLWGERGFVSDDTEQAALVVESLIRGGDDLALTLRTFRGNLLEWLLRLPFALGRATLHACLRILFGRASTGALSAGNGACLRAAMVGVFFAYDDARRRAYAAALARVTHLDVRAIEGALFSAELAALCAREPHTERSELVLRALRVVRNRQLYEAIEGAVLQAHSRHVLEPAYNDGYVVNTLALCTFAFLHAGESALSGMQAAIRAGGDTDTAGAIVGCWLGVLHGPERLPRGLLRRLAGGPFGPQHLAALAHAADGDVPVWSRARALLRNLLLHPVLLGHALRGMLRPLAARSPHRNALPQKSARTS